MGKLIDADAMYKRYCVDKKGLDGIYDATDLTDMLASMPTIDAIPVEWLRERKHWAAIDGDYWAENIISYLLDAWQKEQEAR